MKRIVLTRSLCNRVLKIIGILPKKDMDGQIVYLTCHMIRSETGEEKKILKQYEKGKPADRKDALDRIKKTDAYQKVIDFWSDDRLKTLVAHKENMVKYRHLTFADQRAIDDAEVTICPPEDLTEILEFLRLCY